MCLEDMLLRNYFLTFLFVLSCCLRQTIQPNECDIKENLNVFKASSYCTTPYSYMI